MHNYAIVALNLNPKYYHALNDRLDVYRRECTVDGYDKATRHIIQIVVIVSTIQGILNKGLKLLTHVGIATQSSALKSHEVGLHVHSHE